MEGLRGLDRLATFLPDKKSDIYIYIYSHSFLMKYIFALLFSGG